MELMDRWREPRNQSWTPAATCIELVEKEASLAENQAQGFSGLAFRIRHQTRLEP
jgi:hypothetical protein